MQSPTLRRARTETPATHRWSSRAIPSLRGMTRTETPATHALAVTTPATTGAPA